VKIAIGKYFSFALTQSGDFFVLGSKSFLGIGRNQTESNCFARINLDFLNEKNEKNEKNEED
jgi:alpha-tubulin suppressor-like RCC1 family protein